MATSMIRVRGFTLIELLVVVAILGIMAALAAPSMTKLVATQRVRSVATDLHLALVKTRAEALKRNRAVTLAPQGGNWAAGWAIADPDGGSPLDVRAASPSVIVETGATQVVYAATGRATNPVELIFTVSSAATDAVRCLYVRLNGQPHVEDRKGASC